MKPVLLAFAFVLAATPAYAQAGHEGHTMQADASAATVAFREANARMHSSMDIDYSGDADVDFIRGMIPHHQGAVEMAGILLEYGTDPDVRKLAEGVIAAQQSEIAWMEAWLKAKGQ